MGKLGGRELNPGSDIDLMLFYETDDGGVFLGGSPTELTLHEYFGKVAQRMTATLDDVTDDGFVFRVDLRLRPEGSQGPLVNALPRRRALLRDLGPDVGAGRAPSREALCGRPRLRRAATRRARSVRVAPRRQPRK